MKLTRTGRRSLIGSLPWLLTTGAAVVALGSDFFPQPPQAHTPLEKQGRHLLQIAGGCGCHGANFAGWRPGGADTLPRAAPFGERFVGPFGSVPARNITPDAETGIRGWSDDDLKKAITEGIDPEGERLSPIMPYHAYHGMARSDLRALIAYLHLLRPVKNAVPEKVVPEKVVPSPAPGREAPPALPDAPDVRPTEPVALGRYLVRHVCGCVDCHAPGGQAPDSAPLTGRVLPGDGVTASNLTPDRQTGIGTWRQADIARYLRTGARPDGGLAQSAMAGLIVTSFSKLTPDEANAIAAYLKSLPAVRHVPR
jgi:mono/diheme cytochrome c family protein